MPQEVSFLLTSELYRLLERRRGIAASDSSERRVLLRQQPPQHVRQDAAVSHVLAFARGIEAENRPERAAVRGHYDLAPLAVLGAGDGELLTTRQTPARRVTGQRRARTCSASRR